MLSLIISVRVVPIERQFMGLSSKGKDSMLPSMTLELSICPFSYRTKLGSGRTRSHSGLSNLRFWPKSGTAKEMEGAFSCRGSPGTPFWGSMPSTYSTCIMLMSFKSMPDYDEARLS